MATTAKAIGPEKGALMVLAKVRPYLPADARWDVEYFDDDGIYLLNIFADGIDRMELHKAAGDTLFALSQKGLSMAMVLDGTLTLSTFPSAETYPVHKQAV